MYTETNTRARAYSSLWLPLLVRYKQNKKEEEKAEKKLSRERENERAAYARACVARRGTSTTVSVAADHFENRERERRTAKHKKVVKSCN